MQLSQSNISQLQARIDAGDRAGFYIEYHNLTGSTEALLQAQVSSYSGYMGQLALYANAVAKTYLGNQYPGTTNNFSQLIASDLLDKIKASVADGGTGVFTDDQVLEFARLQWDIRGIGDCFPGNVLVGKFTACTVAVDFIGAFVVGASSNEQSLSSSATIIPGGSVLSPDVPAGGQRVTSPSARVLKDGRISWTKTFGLGAIASVAVMGDVILVAAFEAIGEPVAGRIPARVSLWRFSDAGELLGQQIICDEIAHRPTSSWVMKVAVAADAIYVFSAWTDLSASPITTALLGIVKMDMQGHILWQKEIADTFYRTRIGSSLCVRATVVLSDGSVLADCRGEGGIKLFRLEPSAGEITQSLLPNMQRPNCEGIFGASWFIVQRSENDVWLFGTGDGCTWLQQMSLGDFRK